MRDVLDKILEWSNKGDMVALARVVRTEGSAPRAPGAAMVVNADGQVAGSVSGGCVEGAVLSEALEVLGDGRPRLVRFEYSDDEGFAVGLTCGGIIDIFVAPPSPILEVLDAAIDSGSTAVLATVVSTDTAGPTAPGASFAHRPDGPVVSDGSVELGGCIVLDEESRAEGFLGNEGLERAVQRDAAGALAEGRSVIRRYGPNGEPGSEEIAVFIEVFAPPPEMVIFGAVDFSAALCDARATFATRERFPATDAVVVDWPDRYLEKVGATLGPRDAICILTHDPKFDIPALVSALTTKAGYIGAMGSRHTNQLRRAKLVEQGVDEAELARIMAPIGLDLGAATPEETAIAICAEIIALRNARTPTPLRDSSGPIHSNLDTEVSQL